MRTLLLLLAMLAPATATAQSVGESTGAHGCDGGTVSGWPLLQQLARAQSCMYPELLVPVEPSGGISFSSDSLRFATPQVRDALYGSRDAGASFNVNSAYRTLLEQWWLYTATSPACGSVASPGTSNHESGSALDIQQYGAARPYLEARGCIWANISYDPWHYNCVAATRVTVVSFQRLWNLNNPGDRIDEDNSWGPQTEARLRASPINGFALDGCAPPSCDRTAGRFTFSCDGENAGATCVSVNEPDDPDSWADNYLCSASDEGIRWSTSGPIAGMRCVNVTESADAHAAAWSDDYLCAPSQAPFELQWSAGGAIDGWACVHFNESADPGTWNDNFLCARDVSRFENGDWVFSAGGPVEDHDCVSVDEPGDPDTWSDNYFCSRDDVGMAWSTSGPLDDMTCVAVSEPSDPQAAAWSDNYLCLPEGSRYVFTWHSAGPVEGELCVRWYEAADLAGTWNDNYLCITERALPGDDAGPSMRDAAIARDGGSDPSTRPPLGADCGCRAGRAPSAPSLLCLAALAALIARRRMR